MTVHHLTRPTAESTVRTGTWSAVRSSSGLRRLLLLQAASRCADAAVMLVLAQVVVFELEHGATAGAIGRGVVVASVPALVAGPVAGVLADRWRRRWLLGVVHGLRALVVMGAALIPLIGSPLAGYAAAAALLAAGTTSVTARAAALPHLVPASQLVAANAATALVGKIAGATGVALAVATGTRLGTVVAPAAVLELVAAVGYATFREDLGGGRRRSHTRPAADPVSGRASLARVRRNVGAMVGHRVLYGAAFTSAVLLVDRRYTLEASGHAAALAVTGTGAMIGTLATPMLARRIQHHHLAIASFAISAAAMWTAATRTIGPIALGAMVALSFAFQVVRLVGEAAIQDHVSDHLRGRMVSAFDACSVLSFVAGVLTVVLCAPDRPGDVFALLAALHLIAALAHVRLRPRPAVELLG